MLAMITLTTGIAISLSETERKCADMLEDICDQLESDFVPAKKILPKHTFLLNYGRVIEEIGCIVHANTNRCC